MSGGKGGGSTSQVTIPEYIEQAAQRNLNKAEGISQIGYTPYYGPDVAAFTPMQQAAFQNTANTANAFGMAAPTTQQDIMGGMNAPTVYANGLSGYSSAPMYEESLAELGRQRPGQKAYIDSFFIDPQTGAAGSNVQPFVDYTQYETAAESARRAVADAASGGGGGGGSPSAGDIISTVPADQATDNYYQDNQLYNPDINYTDPYVASNNQIVGTLDPSYDPNYSGPTYSASDFPIGSSEQGTDYTVYDTRDNNDYRSNDSGSTVSVGYGVGQVDPGLASAAGYTSSSQDVDLPGNVISRALNIGAGKKDNSSDGYAGSSGDGTVMCTAYCEMGYLPKAIWALDRRYGVKMYRNDPTLIEGYHMWGVPVANYLRKQTFGAKVLRAIMWPIVKAWAEEMAHNMKPEDYKPNYFGKLIKFVGEPFSRMCAKLKFRKIEEIA